MAFINIGTGDDLVLEIPVKRTVDWADKLREDCFQRIVEHDHSGDGRGRPLSGEGIADNGIDDRKILLRNNEWLRSAGVNPGDPDQNILRVNPTGDLEIAPQKLVMSNGVILNNNGAFASRVEGELTVSDDLIMESKLIAPQPVLTPLDEDPNSPDEGQLQVSDGTSRDKGLWLYQDGNWVVPGVPDESITNEKLAETAKPTFTFIDGGTDPTISMAGRNIGLNGLVQLYTTRTASDVQLINIPTHTFYIQLLPESTVPVYITGVNYIYPGDYVRVRNGSTINSLFGFSRRQNSSSTDWNLRSRPIITADHGGWTASTYLTVYAGQIAYLTNSSGTSQSFFLRDGKPGSTSKEISVDGNSMRQVIAYSGNIFIVGPNQAITIV